MHGRKSKDGRFWAQNGLCELTELGRLRAVDDYLKFSMEVFGCVWFALGLTDGDDGLAVQRLGPLR